MKTFDDALVLLIGGSSGIGLELGKELSRRGANLWILARRKLQLEFAIKEIESSKKKSSQEFGIIQSDITNLSQLTQSIDSFINKIGTPDLLINSAGTIVPGRFDRLKIEEFEEEMRVNYLGVVYPTKLVIDSMIKRGSGYIVNISSLAGFLAPYGYTAYSASKFAVSGFSDGLRLEMKPLGIHVSVVFPPDTKTPNLDREKTMRDSIINDINGAAGEMLPEQVARAIIDGITRNKYAITPGFQSTLFYWLSKFAFPIVHPILDNMVASAIKRGEQRKQL